VLASLVPRAAICAFAARQAALPAAVALHTFVNWSQIRFVMMFGFRASCCPLATTGSVGKKVPSVALRPVRPSWKSMAGEQVPKSDAVAFARGKRGIVDAVAVAAAKSAKMRELICMVIVDFFII